MRFTLRLKLIVLTTLLVTIIMANGTYFFSIRERQSKQEAVAEQMERIARNIATMQLLDRQDWMDYQDYISQLLEVNDDIVYIAVYDDHNLLRAHALNLDLIDMNHDRPIGRMEQSILVRQLDDGAVAPESRNDFRTQRVNIQLGERVLGSVHVGFSLIEINNEIRTDIIRNVLMAFLFLVLFSGIAAFLSQRLTKPLERLSLAMEAVATGDLNQHVQVENRDEIGKLAQTFNEMVDRLKERRIIEDLGQQLRVTFQLDRLASTVRESLVGAIGADHARIFLCKRDGKAAVQELSDYHNGYKRDVIISIQDRTRSFLAQQSEGFTLNKTPTWVQTEMKSLQIGLNELVTPMIVKGELFGFISFQPAKDKPEFDSKRQHFASTLSNQAALALENSMLYGELREQERLKRELEIARDIQMKLLPKQMPKITGINLDGICLPAFEVGGDYYDVFQIDEQKLGIVIADVSGKGTSASFYMAEIKGMMSVLAPNQSSPQKLLMELNKRLYGGLDRKLFATMIYGVLDLQQQSLKFVRAGHNGLLVIKSNAQYSMLTPSGIGLGLESGILFDQKLEEMEISLEKGDTLLFYTDGITEAMNKQFELFGEERLLILINSLPIQNALDLRHCVLKAVEKFIDGAEQHDDLTMVVCHLEE